MAQYKDTLVVKTDTNTFELHGRPCELSAFSFVPPSRCDPKECTYYNVDKSDRYAYGIYDRLFSHDYGCNNKLHRCDREHAKSKGLNVCMEEQSKEVPTLSSSTYGYRLDKPVETRDRKHVRTARVKEDFYRRNTQQTSYQRLT